MLYKHFLYYKLVDYNRIQEHMNQALQYKYIHLHKSLVRTVHLHNCNKQDMEYLDHMGA